MLSRSSTAGLKPFTFYMEVSVYQKLSETARSLDLSMSEFIRQAIDKELAKGRGRYDQE